MSPLGAGQVAEAGPSQGGWHRSWAAPGGALAGGVASGESRCQNITVDRNTDIYTHTQMCTCTDAHTDVYTHRCTHTQIYVRTEIREIHAHTDAHT